MIESFACGEMGANGYLLTDEATGECVVIDPGAPDPNLMNALAGKKKLCGILLTHGHFDHIGGVHAIKKRFGSIAAVHQDDAPLLNDSSRNLSALFGREIRCGSAELTLHDGDVFRFGGQAALTVLHTPGHSAGSVCYLWGKFILSGDTLFQNSVGRTDFPGSNPGLMAESLRKLRCLPGDYRVLPGHGPETTMEAERQNNLYFRNMT